MQINVASDSEENNFSLIINSKERFTDLTNESQMTLIQGVIGGLNFQFYATKCLLMEVGLRAFMFFFSSFKAPT